MAEKVLLAGCGDLGVRVAQQLLKRGDEVWALRRRPPAACGDGIGWLQADLTVPASLLGLPRGITQVVYAPTPDRRDETAYRAIFIDGLRNLLDALDHTSLQRTLLVSSSAVYGEHAGDWVDEQTPPSPPGFNGAVLLEAERWLAAQPASSIVLRLSGLYGPGRLQLIERLRCGLATVPRSRPHWSNRMHINDAAAAVVHLLALTEPYPLYVGTDSTPLRLDALYDYLSAHADFPLAGAGAAPAHVGSKRLSNARLRASGFTLQWPDARLGYAALLDTPHL